MTEDDRERARRALQAIAMTPHIVAYLEARDPIALSQVRAALLALRLKDAQPAAICGSVLADRTSSGLFYRECHQAPGHGGPHRDGPVCWT